MPKEANEESNATQQAMPRSTGDGIQKKNHIIKIFNQKTNQS